MKGPTAHCALPAVSRTVGRAATAMAVMVLALCAQTSVAGAGPNIAVSPSSAPQGGTVTISGNVPRSGNPSCASDPAQLVSTADLFPGDGFGPQVTRDASGNFQTDYVIPAATPAGSYSIGVRCGGGNVGIFATLQVTSGRTTLANTGPSTVAPLLWLSLGLVVLGLLLTRRRRLGVQKPPQP
jgi:LPXTG-motif cell wall-anchored protein